MKTEKVLLSLLLLTGLVFANCYDFVALANNRLAPPYPSYFGAAGEYMHAADCYAKQGDATQARNYYEKSGDYYITAAQSLLKGADNFLRAQSYENAGEAYAKAGMKQKAITNYKKAQTVFNTYGYEKQGAEITGLIIALTTPQQAFNYSVIIGIVSLLALIFSLVAIAYLFIQNEELKQILRKLKPRKKQGIRQQRIVTRRASDFASNFAPEKPKQKLKEININIKEKYAKKLREKYLPKH